MKLINGTIRPGVVLQVNADGTIKASAPGLFSDSDAAEDLPVIYPFPFTGNSNQYSAPEELDEVWIVNFTDNPLQLYWFRKDTVSDGIAQLGLGESADVEILCNREVGMGFATIYFSNGSGWVIQNNTAKITLQSDGSIVIDAGVPNRALAVNSNGISLGSSWSSSNHAVLGEPLKDVIYKITTMLANVQKAASSNPYTASLASALKKDDIDTINDELSSILSTTVTLE